MNERSVGLWLCAGCMAVCATMVAGLVLIITMNAVPAFWPSAVPTLRLRSGTSTVARIIDRQPAVGARPEQVELFRANRELAGPEFEWVEAAEVTGSELDPGVFIIERTEWGPLFATSPRLVRGSQTIAEGPAIIDALPNAGADAALIVTAAGTEKTLRPAEVIRIFQPNVLGTLGRLSIYWSKVVEFLTADPRESNTEGGVWPALFGTVMIVLVMTVFVTPLGVLAAIYLREYARQGRFVSLIRISVNNLAGVPSIVFGVFGLGFFVYGIGGNIDSAFFSDRLPSPTFGTGGMLWASLTLALLTLPTVIVATEEGLAAIPRELREASYALGATRFETTWFVVLPSLMPSILTGMVLAVARAGGEVAPLMLTGVVKLARSLPADAVFPYLHLDRKFMHLAFHLFDLAYQSPNIEAARPLVFASAFLLVSLIFLLNLTALILRNRLRAQLRVSGV